MTKDEAIEVLEMVEAHGIAIEAKRMAIEALKEKPKVINIIYTPFTIKETSTAKQITVKGSQTIFIDGEEQEHE